MGLKDNFKQVAKELVDGPETAQPDAVKQPTMPPRPAQERGQSQPAHSATIIAAGTVIHGTVNCQGDLELYGEVQGDITGRKDLKLQGKLKGNATGITVVLQNIHMEGNLLASGTAQVDENSVIEGDVRADSLILNGKVKGSVQVNKKLHIEGHGMVSGGVTAARLVVEEGAAIQGEVRIGALAKDGTLDPAGKPGV